MKVLLRVRMSMFTWLEDASRSSSGGNRGKAGYGGQDGMIKSARHFEQQYQESRGASRVTKTIKESRWMCCVILRRWSAIQFVIKAKRPIEIRLEASNQQQWCQRNIYPFCEPHTSVLPDNLLCCYMHCVVTCIVYPLFVLHTCPQPTCGDNMNKGKERFVFARLLKSQTFQYHTSGILAWQETIDSVCQINGKALCCPVNLAFFFWIRFSVFSRNKLIFHMHASFK